ncbi:STAS domain-containing protein [Nannocystis pusilla]|uniref:STAS domain-containing protein n=1 Tax=Nannocystis pusilla TaxID=889268 RepID=UPI003B79E99D
MEPTAAERAIEYYRRRLDALVLESCERVRAADLPFYRAFPLAAMQASVKRVFEAVAADLESDVPQAYPAILSALGVQRASMGVSVTEITAGMHFGFEVVSEAFAADFAADPDPMLFWERKRGKIAYAGVAALADAYLVAREALIRTQADEILALSTQVLPLHPGVLVCPLIGHFDRERVEAVTTAVLAAVARHRSRVVLFDLSGVPNMDVGMADPCSAPPGPSSCWARRRCWSACGRRSPGRSPRSASTSTSSPPSATSPAASPTPWRCSASRSSTRDRICPSGHATRR